MRYQFYREHKYVSAALNDLERLIAKTDFREESGLTKVAEEFSALAQMLKSHAQYEDESLHSLLKKKNSPVYLHVEQDHIHQEEQLAEVQSLIDQVGSARTNEEKIALGYKLYLTYRKFVGDNLVHLHEEETIILPELQRLYTDKELQEVEAETYRTMTVDEMKEMLQHLFPYMNPSDKEAFLRDISELEPAKYSILKERLSDLLDKGELHNLHVAAF